MTTKWLALVWENSLIDVMTTVHQDTRVYSQKSKTSYYKISKPWDMGSEVSHHSEIRQLTRQQCCRVTCQISEQFAIVINTIWLLWDFMRCGGKTSYCLMNKGPENWIRSIAPPQDQGLIASCMKAANIYQCFIVYPLRGTQLGTEIWRLTSWIGGW